MQKSCTTRRSPAVRPDIPRSGTIEWKDTFQKPDTVDPVLNGNQRGAGTGGAGSRNKMLQRGLPYILPPGKTLRRRLGMSRVRSRAVFFHVDNFRARELCGRVRFNNGNTTFLPAFRRRVARRGGRTKRFFL